MTIDLLRSLLLAIGLALHGQPQEWNVAIQAAVVLSPDGAALELLVDPVAIYYQVPPRGLCGLSLGQYVLVHPDSASLGCQNTLEHELGHVWQWRAYGLGMAVLAATGRLEPPEPWRQVPAAPRMMRHALLRISFPLR